MSAYDVTYLNEDCDYPCHDGGNHDYRESGRVFECPRCGAEVLMGEVLDAETGGVE